jgi:polar amino acid transport system substrate-binding protein
MKTTLFAMIVLPLAGLCCAAPAVRYPHLTITTESSPPSSMLVDGRVTGFAAEKIRLIMDRVGVNYDIDMLPWKRAYMMAQTQADTCVYSTTRIPERETMFKWVGPLHENDWTLFGRADRDYHVAALEDARNYRIGGTIGDVRSETLVAQGFMVDTVSDRMSNPRKLLVNRIDLWVSSLRVGNAVIAENGWGKEIVPVLTFKRTEQYLACNNNVPDALVARMNAALRALHSEGVVEAIERKYHFVNPTPRH